MSPHRPDGPPRLAEALLARMVGRGPGRRFIVGDLREEFAGVRSRRGPVVAGIWYWCQVFPVGGRLAAQSLGGLGWGRLDPILHDIRSSVRSLRRRPAFAAVAAVALALGIAAATVMFSVVEGVLIKDLPFKDPETLVSLWRTAPEWKGKDLDYLWDHLAFSREQAMNIRENAHTLSGVGLFSTSERMLEVRGGAGSRKVSIGMASADLFPLLGIRPLLGRVFSPEEAPPSGGGASDVAILSYQLWVTRFGADPGIVGRVLRIGGEPHVVVGILREDFRLPSDGWATFYTRGGPDAGLRDVWTPLGEGSTAEVVARLAPNADPEQARAEVQSLIDGDAPSSIPGRFVVAAALMKDRMTNGYGPPLVLLLAAALVLLLVTCVSVAGLMLAEGVQRTRELIVRSALGASRSRVVRTLILEGSILGATGAALAILLSRATLGPILSFAPPIPRAAEIGLDPRVLWVSVTAGIGTAVLAAIIPAMLATAAPPAGAFGSRGEAGSRSTRAAQHGILAVQMALTVILLVVGGLFGRSVLRLLAVDPGFEPGGLVTLQVTPSATEPLDGDERSAIQNRWREILDVAESRPEIRSAALAAVAPFAGLTGNDMFSFVRDGQRVTVTSAAQRRVSANYHSTMGIRLLQGRYLSPGRGDSAPAEMLVSASLASSVWPGESPVGARVDWHGTPVTIVGVVEDVREKDLGTPPAAQFYLAFDRFPMGFATVVARVSGSPAGAMEVLRSAVLAADPDAYLDPPGTMVSLMRASEADDRFRALLVLAFGGLAAIMAALGVAGIAARGVASRRRELGIRKALGATDRVLIRSGIRESLSGSFIGGSAGFIAALWVGRLVSHFLFGIRPADAVTFLVVAVFLLIASALSAWVPARRIHRITPMRAIGEG